DTLLFGLPAMALIAAVATAAWFRLRGPAKQHQPATPGGWLVGSPVAASIARAIGNRSAPLAVLALAIVWVGLPSVGLPYPVFWWMALLAMFGAWMSNLCGESR